MSSIWNLDALYECIVFVSCQSSFRSNMGSESSEDIQMTRAGELVLRAHATSSGWTERY